MIFLGNQQKQGQSVTVALWSDYPEYSGDSLGKKTVLGLLKRRSKITC